MSDFVICNCPLHAPKSHIPEPKYSWSEAMKCICGERPDPMCMQYEWHQEFAGQPGAFPKDMFPNPGKKVDV